MCQTMKKKASRALEQNTNITHLEGVALHRSISRQANTAGLLPFSYHSEVIGLISLVFQMDHLPDDHAFIETYTNDSYFKVMIKT